MENLKLTVLVDGEELQIYGHYDSSLEHNILDTMALELIKEINSVGVELIQPDRK